MLGDLTKFGTTSGLDYGTEKTALNNTASPIVMGDVIGTNTNSTYWQVLPALEVGTFSGSVTQTLTFTAVGCEL